MTTSPGALDVVTGAFSYSGAAIARELRAAGRQVRTLTGHPAHAPTGTDIEVRPLNFHDPAELTRSMRGAHTLYNTYWVRFAHGSIDHDAAVANSQALFHAAAAAGIQRIVHVSITHPSSDSPYPYFRGKARSTVPWLPLRVSVWPFGGRRDPRRDRRLACDRPARDPVRRSGVLINNVAWLLRHVPIFAVSGHGTYRVRGIHIDDLARLCVSLGACTDTVTMDAVGPQTLTFRELVDAARTAVGSHAVVVSVPGPVLTTLVRAVSLMLRDTVLTPEEYHAMAVDLRRCRRARDRIDYPGRPTLRPPSPTMKA